MVDWGQRQVQPLKMVVACRAMLKHEDRSLSTVGHEKWPMQTKLEPEADVPPDDLPLELTDEQAWNLFDEAVQERLDMSADEFVRRYDAGEWPDPDSNPGVIYLAMLRPPLH